MAAVRVAFEFDSGEVVVLEVCEVVVLEVCDVVVLEVCEVVEEAISLDIPVEFVLIDG